jgi:hypothetical protein
MPLHLKKLVYFYSMFLCLNDETKQGFGLLYASTILQITRCAVTAFHSWQWKAKLHTMVTVFSLYGFGFWYTRDSVVSQTNSLISWVQFVGLVNKDHFDSNLGNYHFMGLVYFIPGNFLCFFFLPALRYCYTLSSTWLQKYC